jgi:hypothetical protein
MLYRIDYEPATAPTEEAPGVAVLARRAGWALIEASSLAAAERFARTTRGEPPLPPVAGQYVATDGHVLYVDIHLRRVDSAAEVLESIGFDPTDDSDEELTFLGRSY